MPHLLFEIAVACYAEAFLRFGGHPRVVAGMRVMTGHAFPLFVRNMYRRRFLLEERLFVTRRAEFFALGLEEASIVCAMPEATGSTLSAMNRFMNIGAREFPFQP